VSKNTIVALFATLIASFSASTLACDHHDGHDASTHESKMDLALHEMSIALQDFLVTQNQWGMDRSRIDADRTLKAQGQVGCDYQDDVAKTEIVIRSTDNNSHRGKVGMKAIESDDFARAGNFCTAGANFYIDDQGFVFACRELDKKAAVSIPNTGVIGINVMGSFGEGAVVTKAMKSSLAHVIRSLRHAYGDIPVVPLSRRNAQATKAFPNNPGKAMLDALDEIQSEDEDQDVEQDSAEALHSEL
jgi:hypothetical protein